MNPELSTFDPKKFVEEERKKALEAYQKSEEEKKKKSQDVDIKEKVVEATNPKSVEKVEKTIEFSDFKVPSKIEIKASTIHGNGVFATQDITSGEVIEEARLFRLGWRSTYQKDPVLNRYIIADTSCTCRDCTVHGPSVYMPMGYVGLYNYGFNSNIKAEFDFFNLKMKIVATENIAAGTEILFDDSAFNASGITGSEKLQ
jgi:hypothetical protein